MRIRNANEPTRGVIQEESCYRIAQSELRLKKAYTFTVLAVNPVGSNAEPPSKAVKRFLLNDSYERFLRACATKRNVALKVGNVDEGCSSFSLEFTERT